jgi:hypothetical protein
VLVGQAHHTDGRAPVLKNLNSPTSG